MPFHECILVYGPFLCIILFYFDFLTIIRGLSPRSNPFHQLDLDFSEEFPRSNINITVVTSILPLLY